jgi:hypothetical protein
VNRILARRSYLWIALAVILVGALVLPAAAETVRIAPGNPDLVAVNTSPQAPPAVQPTRERVVVVPSTPAPQRTMAVTTVPTTVPAGNGRQGVSVITTVTIRPTQAQAVLPARVVNGSAGSPGTGKDSGAALVVSRHVTDVNPAGIAGEGVQETTAGVKDPRTGDIIPEDKGAGLPGAGTGTTMPSAADQWNNRFGASGAGDFTGGTPFDKNPGSNSMDGFFGTYGGNIPDPLAAYGTGRPGTSPAESADSGGSSGDDMSVTTNEDGSFTLWVPVGEGADREFYLIEFDAQGNLKTDDGTTAQGTSNSAGTTSNQIGLGTTDPSKGGSRGQQYEGEGGYTGGSGHSANDIMVGSSGRMTGKVPGTYDPGSPGLGQDTGGKTPALFQAIEKYVAQGGKVRGGTAGYQPGDSGLGQDTGGNQGSRVSGLKKAINSQRFVIDPDTRYVEQVPWWLEKKVSPREMSAAQASAMPAGVASEIGANTAGAATGT